MQKRAYVIALALCAMLMGACSSSSTQTATTAPADSPTAAPAATVAPAATDAVAPTEAAATTEAPAATEAPTSAPAGQAPETQTSGGRLQAVKDR
ncbi:MAG TPA: hypothetical protein VFT99_08635, partial [Roseiflexaceae bacterium]|nr:hypothetical protein [Roseiflexaceae bacterium]